MKKPLLNNFLPFVGATLLAASLAAPAAAQQEKFVVVKAGKIITGAGDEISDGEIVIVDGKIRLVGRGLEYPASAEVIDASGETVVPGLVHARARPDMPDYNRSGVRGNVRASAEVYTQHIDFEPFLRHGFTSVAIIPPGLQVAGIASVYHTATAGEDEQLLDVPGYVRMTMNSQPRDKGTLRDAIKRARAEIEKVDKARAEWEAKKKEADAKKAEENKGAEQPKPPEPAPQGQGAQPQPPRPPTPTPAPAPQPQGPPAPAESSEFKAPEMDAAHRPFIDLIQKKAGAPGLVLELGKSSDYVHLMDVLDDQKDQDVFKRWLYLGGTPGFADFNYVVQRMGEAKARVALPPSMHRMPNTVTRYNLVGDLVAAGCEVALVPTGDRPDDLETYRPRIADMARSGIERADVIKAMILNPARMVGADKTLGTIEKGKLADIVFLNADILDPQARVTRVMINGELVWEHKEDVR